LEPTMKSCHDGEERKKAGQVVRPKLEAKASELADRVREACRLMHQQNRELIALFEQQRRELLRKLPAHGLIQ
jgi:hypothetical protein